MQGTLVRIVTLLALVASITGCRPSGPHRSVPEDMVLIPAGSFNMGDTFGEGFARERPVHAVYVSAFYMKRHEVTNDEVARVFQWAYNNGLLLVTASNVTNKTGDKQELLDLDDPDCRIAWSDSRFGLKAAKGEGYPCVEITWYGAVAYCNYQSQLEEKTPCYDLHDWSCNWAANGYRLPSEAEWEKAARGEANGMRFSWAETNTISFARANYSAKAGTVYDESARSHTSSIGSYAPEDHHPDYRAGGYPFTSPVGSFVPNGYGLYDMVGNVSEWCWDWLGDDYYAHSEQNNPRGPKTGTHKVVRGGNACSPAKWCTVAGRSGSPPMGTWRTQNDRDDGFRTALSVPQKAGMATGQHIDIGNIGRTTGGTVSR